MKGILLASVVLGLMLTSLTAVNASAPELVRHGTRAAMNQLYSLNWAGYAVASDFTSPIATVTSAQGSWIVPTVEPTGRTIFSSVWVGVGGFFQGDNSLLQAGTGQDSGHQTTVYFAWTEALPQGEVPITSAMAACPVRAGTSLCLVQAGDRISASVTLTDAANDGWTLSLADATQGWSFSKTFTYASSRLSGEWIVERPSLCGSVGCRLTHLARFGTALLGRDYTGVPGTDTATIGGVSTTVGAALHQRIAMVGGNVVIAQPSDLSLDGTSFGVVRTGK